MANLEVFQSLPAALVARIVSFNIESTADYASHRLVSKSFGRMLLRFLRSGPHWLRIPPRRVGEESFIERLLAFDPDDIFELYSTVIGTKYKMIVEFDYGLREHYDYCFQLVFDRVFVREMFLVGPPTNGSDELPQEGLQPIESFDLLQDLIVRFDSCERMGDLETIYEQALIAGLFNPVERSSSARSSGIVDNGEAHIFPTLITCELRRDAPCIVKKGDGYVHIRSTFWADAEAKEYFMALDMNCVFRAVIESETESDYVIRLLMHCISFRNVSDFISDAQIKSCLVFDEIQRSLQEVATNVEGVAIADEILTEDSRMSLLHLIDQLADQQTQQGLVDYHPHSDNVVRDLLHPGLYSYVKGVTPLRQDRISTSVEPCIFPSLELGERVEQADGEDFWGRNYEDSIYQWLPTYFDISSDGECRILDYINNLTPRENPVHSSLYAKLEQLFSEFLPFVETVYSYVLALRPNIRSEAEVDYDGSDLTPLNVKYHSLRGQKVQVITKIVDYELNPGQKFEGVWHVEGMSHEEIVLTALYIADRDDLVVGGDLLFQRAFLKDEANRIFSGVNQFRPTSLESIIQKGLIPLGRVETKKGRLIVFPNSHVHKVDDMVNLDSDMTSSETRKRRIVVFFLVNPMRRIVSTREVEPQQKHSGGKMEHIDALEHRLKLMKERKLKKQDWNVREIELCEH